MEKGLKKVLIVSGIVGALAGFSYFIYRQMMKAINYKISSQGVKVLSRDKENIKLLVKMGITNPSDLTLTLTEQEYDIYLNGIYITRLKSVVPQVIYENSTSTLELTVDINYKDILSKMNVASGTTISEKLAMVANLKQQKLKLSSKLSIKYGILPSIPIVYDYEDTLKGWGL
jgi:LEA14-like dessication related protein